MDNYFTNVPLFLNLLSSSTYACGTIRSNRKYLPESFQEKKVMTQGEHEFWQTGNLVATIWQDKRSVYLLSCCKATGNDSVSRQGKERKAQLVPCPPSVKLYTSKMGGVDRSDRMVRTYSTSRRGKKWWYRLFLLLWTQRWLIVTSSTLPAINVLSVRWTSGPWSGGYNFQSQASSAKFWEKKEA